jgi:hypothetical protein
MAIISRGLGTETDGKASGERKSFRIAALFGVLILLSVAFNALVILADGQTGRRSEPFQESSVSGGDETGLVENTAAR